ncbi:hypothetical protein [Bradyrhizobium yuanmingense]|uniref:Transposase n=1 Tax=Bradyrhizobium yuanmingense TaxID=108015 RepID=A0ABV4G7G0_9BRAD|nr:hypothetical protein [Bradyrhizobium yuanmingense]
MAIKQTPLVSDLQCCRPKLIGDDNVADAISVLRDENDRLRLMAKLLSTEIEYMRRSLLLIKSADWRPPFA